MAETGIDMSHFPSADHFVSWAGLAPGINESAGKKKPAQSLPGNKHLRSTLVECVWAASRSKGNFFKARFWRLASKIGKKKATVAVARSMLVAIYHMLKNNTAYVDLGADYYANLHTEKIVKRSIHTLCSLGYTVNVPSPRDSSNSIA